MIILRKFKTHKTLVRSLLDAVYRKSTGKMRERDLKVIFHEVGPHVRNEKHRNYS
jgi:hypothetical protein